jgi:uncharacterized protein (UPF0548 family)
MRYAGRLVAVFCHMYLRRPSDAFVEELLARHPDAGLTYPFPGATRQWPAPRPGWNVDHERVLLGYGGDVFQRGRAAIEQWAMFPAAVATVFRPGSPVVGQNVAVRYFAAAVRLWTLFPARVIYVLDEQVDGCERYGFGYGTLPGHLERGEERFLVEWDRRDDAVWYDLLAVSRPGHWLAWLGYPYARMEQARFRRLSGEAMREAVR